MAILAARAASNKKATDPKVMDLGDLLGITDYFVVCSASNDRQVRTIVEEIEKSLKESVGIRPRAVEGLSNAAWVLMDYGDIVVHVMSDEARAFYAIERLWSDAQIVEWENVA
ncbi:MAG: ribosome silencing factor [Acidimicrobiaceae bacterium]|nr:ribosome silencing factor [Acidimicrobiaceae bacterium]